MPEKKMRAIEGYMLKTLRELDWFSSIGVWSDQLENSDLVKGVKELIKRGYAEGEGPSTMTMYDLTPEGIELYKEKIGPIPEKIKHCCPCLDVYYKE